MPTTPDLAALDYTLQYKDKTGGDEMMSMSIVKKIFGTLYVMAGIAKAFPQLEDVGEVLRRAATANQGTILSAVSDWFAGHPIIVSVIVGVALVSSGICYLTNRLLIPAAIGQILMLGIFITILHRAYWQIFIVDAVFLLVAALVLREQLNSRNAVPSPVSG